MIKSMPLILHHLAQIVDVLLRHARVKMARSSALRLLAALARDIREEFCPHYARVFAVLVELLDVTDPDALEDVFQCVSYLFKYLARYIVRDLATFLEPYQVLLAHSKPFVRRFAGESF